MNFDVVSFGSAVVDTFVNTDVSNRNNFLRYPVGAKMLITDLRHDVGGGGTNTSVAFSRLGLKAGCIGAVGDDENGSNILNLLKKEGVSFLGPINRKHRSGYSVILDSKHRDRTILTYKGCNDHIKMSDIKPFKTKWLYLSSMLKASFKTQKALATKLYKEGVKIALNPSSYHIKNEHLLPLLKKVELLIVNKEEAKDLCHVCASTPRFSESRKKSRDTSKASKEQKDPLIALASLGPRIVVITDKHNPVRCLYEGKEYTVTPRRNVKVAEMTGAGDALASGVVAGLIVDMPIQKCLELGLKESEAVIGHLGAKNNLIKKDLKKLMKGKKK